MFTNFSRYLHKMITKNSVVLKGENFRTDLYNELFLVHETKRSFRAVSRDLLDKQLEAKHLN